MFGVTTAAQSSVTNVAAQILAANQKRKSFSVQNTGTTILRLVLGTGTPTQTVYHYALGACTVADDGTGGVYLDSSWVGAVQCISSAVGGTCVITEVTVGSPNWNLAADGGTLLL